MPPDPILLADTRAWLTKAATDLRSATVAMAATPPILEDALYHCQQASEKTLKAFLTFHDQAFRKTHNLEELGEACLKLDGSLQSLIDQSVPLTEYAWLFRYPGEPLVPTEEEARSALTIAKDLNQAILDRIPPEARPQT